MLEDESGTSNSSSNNSAAQIYTEFIICMCDKNDKEVCATIVPEINNLMRSGENNPRKQIGDDHAAKERLRYQECVVNKFGNIISS